MVRVVNHETPVGGSNRALRPVSWWSQKAKQSLPPARAFDLVFIESSFLDPAQIFDDCPCASNSEHLHGPRSTIAECRRPRIQPYTAAPALYSVPSKQRPSRAISPCKDFAYRKKSRVIAPIRPKNGVLKLFRCGCARPVRVEARAAGRRLQRNRGIGATRPTTAERQSCPSGSGITPALKCESPRSALLCASCCAR